jgi:hypothetical protein
VWQKQKQKLREIFSSCCFVLEEEKTTPLEQNRRELLFWDIWNEQWD